jgi:hypothetical protein
VNGRDAIALVTTARPESFSVTVADSRTSLPSQPAPATRDNVELLRERSDPKTLSRY